MRRTGFQEVTAAGLIVWMAILPSIAMGAPDALYWEKVDFYVNEEGRDREEKRPQACVVSEGPLLINEPKTSSHLLHALLVGLPRCVRR